MVGVPSHSAESAYSPPRAQREPVSPISLIHACLHLVWTDDSGSLRNGSPLSWLSTDLVMRHGRLVHLREFATRWSHIHIELCSAKGATFFPRNGVTLLRMFDSQAQSLVQSTFKSMAKNCRLALTAMTGSVSSTWFLFILFLLLLLSVFDLTSAIKPEEKKPNLTDLATS